MGRRAGTKNGQGKAHLARQKEQVKNMVSVGLWAELHNLADEIIAGNAAKLADFQQMVQYAPDKMRLEVLDYIEKRTVPNHTSMGDI